MNMNEKARSGFENDIGFQEEKIKIKIKKGRESGFFTQGKEPKGNGQRTRS